MSSEPDTDAGADDALLRRLERVADVVDPIDDAMTLAARSALAYRSLDAELAELTYDSLLDDAWVTAMRGNAEPRLLTFTSRDVALEIQVSVVVLKRRLVGQVAPAQPANVEVRHKEGVVEVEADELGRFIVDDLAAGPLSLRCSLAGTPARTLETDAIVV
jgi:hypothetical protein